VGNRRAENPHDGVADVVVDMSPELLNERVAEGEVPITPRMDFFRIELAAKCRIAGNVRKEDRYMSSLALDGRSLARGVTYCRPKFFNSP
jgi:hypothetical protein